MSNVIVKRTHVVKKNVTPLEHIFQVFAGSILGDSTPEVINYNPTTHELKLSKINGMSLADMYGEDINEISENILKSIKNLLQKLWDNGILYRDVTAYNFMIDDDGEIYIVDFEHAVLLRESSKVEYCSDRNYVSKFLKGEIVDWNENFK